jgi:cytoskeletal protein CcmA (bactofilin family)
MFNKKPTDREYPQTPGALPPPFVPEPSPAPPARPETTTAATSSTTTAAGAGTFLAEGTTFEGKAHIAGTMRVEGKADGEIEATESIVVGRTGIVQANLKTRRAVLNGRFQGTINATDRVEMQTGSRVDAEVHAKNMVMEDGVQYSGNCRIGQ